VAKTHYSCAELATLKLPDLPGSEMGWHKLIKRESWPAIEIACAGGKGGIRREYAPPERIAKLIASRAKIQESGRDARKISAAVAAIRAERESSRNAKITAAADDIYGQLTGKGQKRFDATFDIVMLWRNWFAAQNAGEKKIGRNQSFEAFSAAYNGRHLAGVSREIREAVSHCSPRSIQRWVLASESKGLLVMADKRSVKGGGISEIERHPTLEKLILAVLTEKPNVQHTHLWEIINARATDDETGEILWPGVSYSCLNRYINKWKEANAQVFMAVTNPDAWKSKYMGSLGRADAGIVRLNQRWEMDGTPADWALTDGRHTASVVLDIYSRRPRILFSRTPRTETNKLLLRGALLDWGVPEEIATDNGSDYVSREMLMCFAELAVNHHRCAPFSPWQKPHVESFIKTYLHGLLELLDNFIGHSVAERSEIESRASFSDQLFKKNAVVHVELSSAEMQRLSDAWIEGTYMHNVHSGIDATPFERVAAYPGAIRRIEYERALDILLAKPVKRCPVITAKGIRYDKADFIHADLLRHIGKDAEIRLDPNDLGRLIVRVDGQFVCIADNAQRMGIRRAEVAAHGRAMQASEISKQKKALKAMSRGLPSTDQIVRDLVMKKAVAAGKLAHLPKRSEAYETDALRDAARAADRLDGVISQITPDGGVIVPAAIDIAPASSPIPATPDARYHKWVDLHARVTAGMPTPEFEIGQVARFYETWAGGPEGKAMLKKYAPQKETAKPATTGLAMFIR
jgi:transposase InsO family protein